VLRVPAHLSTESRKFIVFLQSQLGLSAEEADAAWSTTPIPSSAYSLPSTAGSPAVERLLCEINGEADERNDEAA
jgi:hypothetical protein